MSRLRGIEAVVFDMDGVLIDSEPFWQEAEIEVFAEVGLRLDREDCRQTMGMRIDEVVAHWQRERPWSDAEVGPDELQERILEGVIGRVTERGARLPGVAGALRGARERGWRTALASSSPERVIDATLLALDLDRAFEVAVSAEHEERGKPDPAVYRTTCAELGVAPERAVAIEDSLAGLGAALAAGMVCVLVPDPSLAGGRELERADVVLDSLTDLDARAWNRVERAGRERLRDRQGL